MNFTGQSGDDNLTGTNSSDTFDLTQGGNDTASGLAGTDTFNFGGTLTATDHVDGGSGNDTVNLTGDYSAGLTLGATTLTSVETLSFGFNFSYDLTTNDANVAAGQTMTIAAASVNQGHSFTFNGAAETDGSFNVLANGLGVYAITGGQGDDTIDVHATFNQLRAGNDFVDAGGGDDHVTVGGPVFAVASSFGVGDLQGGSGADTLTVKGEVAFDMASLSAASLGFETLVGLSESEIFGDANANAFDFTGFTAGSNATVDGEGGNDTLTAGSGVYIFYGDIGNDTLTAGDAKGQYFNGGDGDDLIVANAGTRASTDNFVGGTGADTLDLNGGIAQSQSNSLTGFEFINLGAGFNYTLTRPPTPRRRW